MSEDISCDDGMLFNVFSDSLWPGGYPAPPAPERSEATKHITRVVARAKLLGSMPGDLLELLLHCIL